MGEIGVLTVSEYVDGALDPISAELLGAARKLADELGHGIDPGAEFVIAPHFHVVNGA